MASKELGFGDAVCERLRVRSIDPTRKFYTPESNTKLAQYINTEDQKINIKGIQQSMKKFLEQDKRSAERRPVFETGMKPFRFTTTGDYLRR